MKFFRIKEAPLYMAPFFLCVAIAFYVFCYPILTNDGPIHLSFSYLIANMDENPLQARVYIDDFRFVTNALAYAIMIPFIELVSPSFAESVIQCICLISPVVLGYLLIRRISRDNAFLAAFILPLSFNQMFFLGLYNYCLSISLFLVCLIVYDWLFNAPSFLKAVLLSVALLATFLAHPSGFIIAWCSLAAVTGVNQLILLAEKMPLKTVVFDARHLIVALCLPLAVVPFLTSSDADGAIGFGPGPVSRAYQFLTLRLLNIAGWDSFVALGVAAVLLAGGLWAALEVFRNPDRWTRYAAFGDVSIIAAGLVSGLIMMIFPDLLGGGWTHFRRFVVFPYLWLVLLMACQFYPLWAKRALAAVAAVVTVLLLGSVWVSDQTARAQIAPLAQADGAIGSHCTVLPVVFSPFPVDSAGKEIMQAYTPFFQAASRLELHDDRVILFNYLARLNVYPVRFRPEAEPMGHLFHWEPYTQEVSITQIDIEGYEKHSGIPVDYLLVWGTPAPEHDRLWSQVEAEAQKSDLVLRSEDGRMSLYRRPTQGSTCVARDSLKPDISG